MRLRVISNYGEIERLVADKASPEIVKSKLRSVDWQGFHQGVIQRLSRNRRYRVLKILRAKRRCCH